jgi:hypothetical protein
MRIFAVSLAVSFSLLAAGCKEVPLNYNYGPPVTNFGQPHFANNGAG